jgi:hypothetical protein
VNKKYCSLEKQLLTELKKGELGPETKQHLKECTLCRQTLSVYNLMNRLHTDVKDSFVGEKKLLSPEALTKQAFLLMKTDNSLKRRALKPLKVAQYGMVPAVILITGILILLFSLGIPILPESFKDPSYWKPFLNTLKTVMLINPISVLIVLIISVYMTISKLRVKSVEPF